MIMTFAEFPMLEIESFCRKWKIREFSVFGSILRDDFGPQSDVDVLVALRDDSQWSLWDWIEMKDELRAILGREVDLLERSGLRNPIRRREILRTRKVLYAA